MRDRATSTRAFYPTTAPPEYFNETETHAKDFKTKYKIWQKPLKKKLNPVKKPKTTQTIGGNE